MEANERRRIVLATAFTLVALPAIWVFDRDDVSPSSGPSIAAAGVPAPPVDVVDEGTVTTEPEVPVFLDNTVIIAAPAVVDVASPSSVDPTEISGTATYKQLVEVPGTCTAPGAPSGVTITVVNVDSGRSLTCVNALGITIPFGTIIAIDTELFTTFADLVDSPAPVRISW